MVQSSQCPRSFQKSLQIVKQIEARLSANLGTAIYGDEMASELRISVRTMHTAMLKIRGMSLSISPLEAAMGQGAAARWRQGAADQSMRAFRWLLASGRVCALYAAQFGEAPSITLARSQQRP
jgi:hypothetical protein